MFSKTFGYALRAAIYIAKTGPEHSKIALSELANQLEIPHHFLGKIMQDLVRHGILASMKGPNGGFFCNDQTRDTRLIEVLRITDGNAVFESCVLGIQRCNSQYPCPMHQYYGKCRDIMLDEMQQKTIGDLAAHVEQGIAFLSTVKGGE